MSQRVFKLHLDAVTVITLLFALSLGLNLYFQRTNSELVAENIRLRIDTTMNALNLGSCREALDTARDESDPEN